MPRALGSWRAISRSGPIARRPPRGSPTQHPPPHDRRSHAGRQLHRLLAGREFGSAPSLQSARPGLPRSLTPISPCEHGFSMAGRGPNCGSSDQLACNITKQFGSRAPTARLPPVGTTALRWPLHGTKGDRAGAGRTEARSRGDQARTDGAGTLRDGCAGSMHRQGSAGLMPPARSRA